MSPEQARGLPVDKRTDIWAFGCVLYEMLTGRMAFPGSTLSDTLVSVLEREPDWSALPSSTPTPVRRLLERTLEKDPRKRLRDIADAVVDLDTDDGDARQPSPGPGGARRWMPVAAAFLLGALAMWFWPRSWREPAAPALNGAPPVSFTMAPPDGWMFGSFVQDVETTYVAMSPDGTQLAFVAIQRGGTSAVWLRQLASTQPRLLRGTDGAVSVFWSPDGRTLAFFARDKLQRLELPDGVPVTITDVPTRIGLTGTWGDGRILFDSVQANQISSVSPAGGVPTAAVKREDSRGEFRLYWPRFLPDGQHAMYLARHEDGTGDLRLLDPSGASRSIMRVTSNAEYVDPGYLVFARDSTLLAQPFDLRSQTISGQPAAIADTVDYCFYPTRAAFSASRTGAIAYQSHRDVSRLSWFDRTGKRVGTIDPPGEYAFMRLSPDGHQVAIAVRDPRAGTQDVWTMDLARGGMMRPLTSDSRPEVPGPWLPGNRAVLFGAARTGMPQLHYKDLGTGEERPLLPVGDFQLASDITPDGQQAIIARRALQGSGWDLHTLRLDGTSDSAPLIVSAFNELEGRLSPDGQLLAFISDESKRFNVYVTTFPPAGRPVQITADGASSPRWSHDGRELFFMSAERTLMAVPIRQTPRLEAGDAQALFPTGPRGWLDFEVAPDGRFLAHEPEIIAREQPLTVIVNWPARVTR
jgi:Tol biopolymer transport system component